MTYNLTWAHWLCGEEGVLFHLRRLRKFWMPPQILRNFCSCTIKSVLMGNITVWYGNSSEQDRKDLQRVVRSAERIIGGVLPCLKDMYIRQCKTKARRIVKDLNHPDNVLTSLLWSRRRYRIHQASTKRLRKSFYPQATRIQNEDTAKELP